MSPLVVLCHGFARGPQAMQALAWRCAAADLTTVRPRFTAFGRDGINSTRAVDAVARRLIGHPWDVADDQATGVARGSLVIAGHSAGASVAAALATRLSSAGVAVRGLVLIDGVDNRAGMARTHLTAGRPAGTGPILLVDSRPGPCNRHGALSQLLLSSVPGVAGWRVTDAGHGDIERWIPGAPGVPTGVGARRVASPWAYRLACRDTSDPATADVVQRLAAAAISGLAGADGSAAPEWPPAWDSLSLATIAEGAGIRARVGAQAGGLPVTTLLPGGSQAQ